VLNDNNFSTDGPPSSKDTWLVKFYAPWCGHCKSLAPTWEALASELKGKVKVAKMDVTADSSMTGKDYSVQGFPTIMRFNNGRYKKHTGGRSLSDLKAFAADKASSDDASIPGPKTGWQLSISMVEVKLKDVERMTQRFVQQHGPVVLASVVSGSLLMLMLVGFFLGYYSRNYKTCEMKVKFTVDGPMMKLGLVAVDSKWTIKTGKELGKEGAAADRNYYVSKRDASKYHEIPPLMEVLSAPAPPPDKKND